MENHPHNQARSSRKAGLFGGVVGTLGLTAAIFAMSATAGAAAPVLQAQDADSTPAVEDVHFAMDEAAWAPYDECISKVFEDHGIDFSDVEVLEAEMIAGEIVAVDDFDMDFGTAVSIMDGDDLSFAEFGDGDGTITIIKSGDEITVDTAGDVTVEDIDWDEEAIALDGDMVLEGDMVFDGDFELHELSIDTELDNELSGCDDKLPEGFDLDTGFDLDSGFEVAEATEAAVLTEG